MEGSFRWLGSTALRNRFFPLSPSSKDALRVVKLVILVAVATRILEGALCSWSGVSGPANCSKLLHMGVLLLLSAAQHDWV